MKEKELLPLEVYTCAEILSNAFKFWSAVDERGSVYVIRHPRGMRQSRLYKITAMGPYKLPIRKDGKRQTLPNVEPEKIDPTESRVASFWAQTQI